MPYTRVRARNSGCKNKKAVRRNNAAMIREIKNTKQNIYFSPLVFPKSQTHIASISKIMNAILIHGSHILNNYWNIVCF